MAPVRTYRCLNCLEETVERDFDVSHISRTCSNCDSFERFLNEDVYDQFRAFEDSPPDNLDWSRLGRVEKLMVCEQIVRGGRSIDDFELSE